MQTDPIDQPRANTAEEAVAAIARGVRQAREEAGISQRDLAERLGPRGLSLDPSAITRMERGGRPVKAVELILIADVLGTTVSRLLGEPAVSPADTLEELRMQCDWAMNRTFEYLTRWLEGLLDVQHQLETHPALLERLKPDGDQSEAKSPASADEYLPWVAERVHMIERQVVIVPSEREAEDLRWIAANLAGQVLYRTAEEVMDNQRPSLGALFAAEGDADGEHPEA